MDAEETIKSGTPRKKEKKREEFPEHKFQFRYR
jgi:hypothetical protein